MQALYNPQSLNRYSYCINNPLIYTDPSGHFSLWDWMKWFFGGSEAKAEEVKVDVKVENKQEELAKKVYGETGSLRPQWEDPKGKKDSSNYNKKSTEDLAESRERIAGIGEKEPSRISDPKEPNLKNEHAKDVFDNCLTAVKNKIDPKDTRHFVIWPSKDGKTPDKGIPAKWPYDQKDKITTIKGPFRNTLTGIDTYVFFYKGVP